MTTRNNKKQLIRIKQQSGSSTLLVLVVIIILMMLGTSVLMASVTNIRLGSKYRNWTQAFYILDEKGEGIVKAIDAALQRAETYTQQYIKAESYKILPDDLSTMIPSVPVTEYALTFDQQTYLNNRWSEITTDQAYIEGTEAYREGVVSDFLKQLNIVLYYTYAKNILDKDFPHPTYTITESNETTFNPISPYFKTWMDLVVNIEGPRDNMAEMEANIEIAFMVSDLSVSSKRLSSKIKVLKPIFEPQMYHTSYKIPANPIWSYALNAGKNITVNSGAQLTINGDIIASADTSEGTKGILFQAASGTNIYGNVYTRGDFVTFGSNTWVQVRKPDIAVYDIIPNQYRYKHRLYKEDDLMLDKSVFNETLSAGDWIELTNPDKYFLSRDIMGGNVYCDSLLVDDSGTSNQITISGTVWTYDDIELNGTHSNILIEGSAIGLQDSGAFVNGTIDNNASSAIINNGYETCHIRINGNVVVPGVVYIQEIHNADNSASYYKMAESISANNPEIFSAYMSDWSLANDGNYEDFYISDNLFKLYKSNDTSALFDFIKNYYDTNSDILQNIHTNITLSNPELNGYTLGLVMAHSTDPNAIMQPVVIGRTDTTMQDNYARYRVNLIDIYRSKSTTFGTKITDSKYPYFVNKNENAVNALQAIASPKVPVYYITEDYMLDLTTTSSPKSGIIYCTGNIMITGNGQAFNGTVIAEGNITISGNVTINYNEEIIARNLATHEPVAAFFNPSNRFTATPLYYTSKEAGIMKPDQASYPKRYRVDQWKEVVQ